MEKLDCRGKVCPEPVLMTRAFLEKNPGCPEVEVYVDNGAAAENVKRFLENKGYQSLVEGSGKNFFVRGFLEEGRAVPQKEASSDTGVKSGGEEKILIMITNDRIGRGDPVLGSLLMKNFINTLNEMGDGLWRIVCVNEGVRLCLEGTPTLEGLQTLSARGISILVCGTCLEHYGLTEKKAIGVTTNMLDIVTSLELADRVINL